MTRILNSVEEPIERPWLDEQFKKRALRTFLLGKSAIDNLLKEKKDITYRSISEKTKELDPEGHGIHPNSVKRNRELYEYYKEYSKTYSKKKVMEERNKASTGNHKFKGFDSIKAGRNISDVKKRYNRLKKTELINRLLECEEYIAEQNERWISTQFDILD